MWKKWVCVAAAVLAPGMAYHATAGQLAYWAFDEGAGTTARDGSGKGNNGRLMNGATWADGKFGKALKLDGVDDYVQVPHSPGLCVTTEVTVSVWVNPERTDGPNASGYAGIIAKGNPPRSYSLYTRADGTLHFSTGPSGAFIGSGSTGAVPINEWTHIVVKVEGGQHKYFLNAQPSGVGGTGVTLPGTTDTAPVYIGRTPETNREFQGLIDEVRLYDVALTDAEITDLYNNNPPSWPKAQKPDPADGATGVGLALLQWTPGDGAVLHDVYFGTSPELTAADLKPPRQNSPVYYAGAYTQPGVTYYWRIDEVTADGTVTPGDVWSFTTAPVKAFAPSPSDGAKDVRRDATLGWSPAAGAITHDVYFGTSRDDVAAGTGDTSKGNQYETSFDPGPLAGDTTYYWRIDEVDVSGGTLAGDIWQFRTLPLIPISDPNLVGWWELDETEGTFVMDSSGRDNHGALRGNPLWVAGVIGGALQFDGVDDYVEIPHSPILAVQGQATVAVWINAARHTGPGGSQWQGILAKGGAPRLYNLYTESSQVLHFSTGPSGAYIGSLSASQVPLNEWVHVAVVVDGSHVYYLNGEPAGEGGAGATVPGGGTAPFTIGKTDEANFFLGMIDDVRLYNAALTQEQVKEAMQGNPLRARDPQPPRGSEVDIRAATALSWTAGKTAASHDVYLGSDKDAIEAADASSPEYQARQTDTSFPLDGLVEFGGGAYFWRIDEVEADGITIHKGSVWTFTIPAALIVDDFESYNDEEGQGTRIYETWLDGWTTQDNGSTVGYWDPPFAERTIVHGGWQSMPFDYNNLESPFYSEAYREFDPVEDWTVNSVMDLSLWFRGNPQRFVETAPGQYTISSNSGDIWFAQDNFRFVYKRLSGDGSITAKVSSITNTSNWAKAGVMIRDTLDPASTYAFMFPTPDGRRAFQNRPNAGANALSAHSATGAITLPLWVRVERKGAQFTAFYSLDGQTWTQQPANENTGTDASTNPQVINMGASVYIGMVVASNNNQAGPCFAEFSDVVATGSVTGAWKVANVGFNPGNDPDTFYVALQDSTGRTVTVTHPDPGAVNLTTWTEWRIPLSDFTGVNPARVKRMYIGVGDPANTTAVGTGLLYIDDIRVVRPAP